MFIIWVVETASRMSMGSTWRRCHQRCFKWRSLQRCGICRCDEFGLAAFRSWQHDQPQLPQLSGVWSRAEADPGTLSLKHKSLWKVRRDLFWFSIPPVLCLFFFDGVAALPLSLVVGDFTSDFTLQHGGRFTKDYGDIVSSWAVF